MGVFHDKLSIDESMVPYYGRHSAKMFIRGKPIRFGFKIWALCGSDGYPYKLDIYTGRSSNRDPRLPLGQQVVEDMLAVVSRLSEPAKHEVFFDNFFSSVKLFEALSEKNFLASGTIRDNRTSGASKNLTTNKQMKKRDRGTYDYRSNGKVFICKWQDNSAVNFASNHLSHEPVKKTQRFVRGKGKVQVPQPYLIAAYNQGMGGVDLMDRLLGAYRPTIKAKKWWFPLVVNLINLSVVAAWRLYSVVHPDETKKVTHLDFRRDIVINLLKHSEER